MPGKASDSSASLSSHGDRSTFADGCDPSVVRRSSGADSSDDCGEARPEDEWQRQDASKDCLDEEAARTWVDVEQKHESECVICWGNCHRTLVRAVGSPS